MSARMLLALVACPGDDRRAQAAEGAPLGARMAWVAFPLLTVALMAFTLLMILTRLARRA